MPTYNPPDGTYTQQIPSGTQAFRQEVARHFGFTRTEVIRDQSRCRQKDSEHCSCRAIDFFTTNLVLGREVFEWCMDQGDWVQSVIFNRRVWGFGNWTERAYSGPSPHTDHIHVGLNKWASQNVNATMVRERLEDDVPTVEEIAQAVLNFSITDAPTGQPATVREVLQRAHHNAHLANVALERIENKIDALGPVDVSAIKANLKKLFDLSWT